MATAMRESDREGVKIERLACLALTVSDLDRAARFYSDCFGLTLIGRDVMPNLDAHALLSMTSGQSLALVRSDAQVDLTETGVHHGLRVGASARAQIGQRLAAQGLEIHDYREDRAAEANDNFYLFDPDGNRLQLVSVAGNGAGVIGLDHTAIQAFDMLWAEDFYVGRLGLPVEGRVGWKTADHARARIWVAGNDHMAPGTRRLDKLYMTMGGQNEVPRANMQIFLNTGDSMLMLYLATRHFQEPPEEQTRGSPRTIFAVSRAELDHIASLLEGTKALFEGPVEHGSRSPLEASLYIRDPSGNFLEFCALA